MVVFVTTILSNSLITEQEMSFKQVSEELGVSTWVGDITYIPTNECWLYLAIVKDLCSKKVVGYSFSLRIDSDLVCDALKLH